MRLIGLAVVLALGLSLGSQVGEAQQKDKVPRIAVIWFGTPPSPPLSPTSSLVQFRESLGELGYVEGQGIEIESRFVGDGTGLDQVVEDLIGLKVAVIVAMNTSLALAAKNSSTRSIPVVFSIAGDPVRWGLVKSLAHPWHATQRAGVATAPMLT
jgi:putative ABC transport system substrate-binding protein